MYSMRLSFVYGNPPYDGDLHLKILTMANSVSDQVVWLHPARWIQSLTSPKELRHLNGHIKDISLVRDNTKVLFCGMDISGELVISTFIKSGGKNIEDINRLSLRSLIWDVDLMKSAYNKVMNKMTKSVHDYLVESKLNKYSVVFSIMGGNGGQGNAKMSKLLTSNHDCVYHNGIAPDGRSFSERRSKGSPEKDHIEHVEFESNDEAFNFKESLKTPFMIWVNSVSKIDIHVHDNVIPFMVDYKEPWTEERLCEYFNISPEEKIAIEEAVSNPNNY